MHRAIFFICCGMSVVTVGVLIYSLIKFRQSPHPKAAHFHKHVGVEIVWTLLPIGILMALAMPATTVLKSIHEPILSALPTQVTGSSRVSLL